MLLVLLIVLLPLAWMAMFKYRRRHMYKLARPIPAPEVELPVIGIAHKLMGNTEDIMTTLSNFSYECTKHNGIIKGWLGHILYFVLINPADLEVVLKTCLEKDDLHRFLRKVIGYGGIFAPVSIWRRRRKILVPAFSPKIVENFVEVFSEQSERLAERLDARADTGTFSIWPYLSTYTLDSVCETAMGVKVNAQGNPNSPYLLAMNKVLNLVCERIFHLWLQPDWLYRLFPQYPEHQRCVKIMHDFTDDVIKKKREEIKNQGQNKTKDYDLGTYKRKTFLDLLISVSGGGEKGYTDVELREEVLTLSVAGTDTSAVAVGYTLKLLAMYPAAQEKVYKELHEVFGDSDRPLTKEDLMQLKYLERVVKESLRLYPPVPFIIRKVLEDIKLPSGRILPAGSGVVCSIWGTHRDPKYWGPDADNFDPDRFLPERFNLANTYSFMPFSSGPRNCVGYQYALMSVKTAVSAVLRRYRVVGKEETSPAPTIRVKLDVMMKAVDGYQLALERRRPKPTANGTSKIIN
ncbi:cytochrome P450 4d2-like [Pectinophora gossypiella]|uniref:cytochrome P450 4d2-like n=1 Tax=Pectinophora gossypiella TaxID=13191 RepID=UPI00214E4F01|nr:cytochrome P450 4d2-like [Pectinophora gossypiella]